MGLTYTICYCTYNRKCKSRIAEHKADMFDSSHWGEINENIGRYLAEGICVQDARESLYSSERGYRLLADFMNLVARGRRAENENPLALTELLLSAWSTLSQLSAEALKIASAGLSEDEQIKSVGQTSDLTSGDQTDVAEDPFVKTAANFCQALERGLFELAEAKRLSDVFSTFHHTTLVFDTIQEMHRLACEAMGHLSSERMLPATHPHMRLLEKRWQQAELER